MKRITLPCGIISILTAFLLSCSAGSGKQAPPVDNIAPLPPASQDGGEFINGLLLRDTSGKIAGIEIRWDPVVDNSAEAITGYHIYRSASGMSQDDRGDESLWLADPAFLEDGGGNNTVFPHSDIGTGNKFSYIDQVTPEFPLNLGESWNYRISAINESGDESGLSPEIKIDVTIHVIYEFTPSKAPIGGQLVLAGVNFGQYDAAIDKVFIIGNEWNDTTHEFDAIDIEATVVEWLPTEITVIVPPGAGKGRVKVSIDGLVAQSFNLFENSDPYITALQPYERFLDQNLQINGANFGSAQDGTHLVLAAGENQDDGGNYSIYSDASITLTLKQGTPFGQVPIEVSVNGKVSNTGYMFLKNRLPVAAFSLNKTSGKVPLQINFNASGSNDVEGPIAKYTLDFGDGSPPEEKLEGETPTFSHIYTISGNFEAILTVEDQEGQTDTEQKTINVLPSAEILLIEDIDNGQGVGNNYVPNVQALRDDILALNLDYISGGYSVGIGQVAIDNGVRVTIWMRGGPGPGDPIQDWPRNWSDDEKNDLLTILNAGIDVLLISQNHQFTGDDTSGDDWSTLYGVTKQTDRIQEPGGERPFTWMFGCPTDMTYTHIADSIPSSPVCLKGTFPAGVVSAGAAESFNGTGSSGNIPTGLTIANNRIQMGLAVDLTMIGDEINANFVPGTVADEATYPFKLCYSHGLTTAPDSNIGFSGGGYSHTNGSARLWVVGWSYSEMTPAPGTVSRQDVLQNVLAWLDNGLTLP